MDAPPSSLWTSARCAALAALLIAVGATGTEAQQLRGQVIDGQTREPVPLVEVHILDGELEPLTSALTGATGYFQIDLARGRLVALALTALGYEPSDTLYVQMPVEGDQFMRLALQPRAIELEGFTVVQERSLESKRMRSFYERLERGLGYHLRVTGEDRRNAVRAADLLKKFPIRGLSTSVHAPVRFGRCQPVLYVDDLRIPWDRRPLEDIVALRHVRAMEAYTRRFDIPPYFRRRAFPPCGVLAIWTR